MPYKTRILWAMPTLRYLDILWLRYASYQKSFRIPIFVKSRVSKYCNIHKILKMSNSRLMKISKFLSKHLRHQPDAIGIELAAGGWIAVDELLKACAKNKFFITHEELEMVVANNDKQRFSFDPTGNFIRANQGHSIEIDLQLQPIAPPNILYHGTGAKSVDAIMKTGLNKMSRHHVHLSSNIDTAKSVGIRHGKPVIFAINTQQMLEDDYIFYCSANGVWLVDHVPHQYLSVMKNE
jgi:putative RNA 2'-phosphotransferase